MLVDKQIGGAFARQPHHVLVVVLDPAAHDLAVHQLDRNRLLLFSQRLEEGSLFTGFLRRRRAAVLGGVGISLRRTERHAGIVHKRLVEGRTQLALSEVEGSAPRSKATRTSPRAAGGNGACGSRGG